jgi:hypothetical protein
MQIALMFVAALSVAPVAAQTQETKPPPTIEVKAPKDIAAVKAIEDAMDALGRTVEACVEKGRTREVCACTDPPHLADVRKGYADLIKLHPTWKDQLLFFGAVDKEGRKVGNTLVLEGLRRQLESI